MEITKNVLNDIRDVLIKHINETPGIRYRELLRLTRLANGVLTYHLAVLEKSGNIKVDRKSRMTRYYPSNICAEETDIIGYLKSNTARQITMFILEHELCTFSEIVEYVNKASSTISWHLKRLKHAGIISVRHGEHTLYRVTNRELVSEVLLKYRESFVDKVINNYIEMIDEL